MHNRAVQVFVRLYCRIRNCALRVLGMATRDEQRETRARLDSVLYQLKRVSKEMSKLQQLQTHLDRLEVQLGPRGIDGRLRHVERNVHAVIRRHYIDQVALPFPHNVLSQRFHLWSQNEEDGITLALFKLIGNTNRCFVELGAGVNGGNSGFLAEVCGWTGLMVDGSHSRAHRLVGRFGRFGVSVEKAGITTGNVNDLVRDNGCAGDIDLLSVDIDGCDYWVWDALIVCSPRMIIVEFNPAFGSRRAVTVQYDPAFDRADYKSVTMHFYGASLAALVRLGRTKGYRLVLVEPRGANAYFLRNDVGVDIPEASADTIHPRLMTDPQPLFDLIEKNRLPLVDLDASPSLR